jgi:hypothetical protein
MNGSEVRDLFVRSLPEQPVAGRITRESAVLAGRVARRRRRQVQVAIVVAAFCAVVLGLLAPSFLTGGRRGLGPAAPSISATPDPSISATPGPSISATPGPSTTPARVASPSVPAAQISARPGDLADMSAALLAKAHQLLPTATFSSVTVGFEDGNRDLAPFVLTDNQHGYYIAEAQVEVPETVGTLTILMWPRSDSFKSPSQGCSQVYQPQLSCDSTTGPAGERIWILTGYQAGTATLEYLVEVFRPDGTITEAKVNNQATNQPARHTTNPPVTVDQLIALMTIPGLSLVG